MPRLFLETLGCQMNVLDSELVASALRRSGYTLAGSVEEADLVLFNTCSIREHAEDKVYSALGRLKAWKRERPEAVLGVLGCMAQKDQEAIFRRAPHVDLLVGPGGIGEVPELLEQVKQTRGKVAAFSLDRKEGSRREVEASFASFDPLRDPGSRVSPFQAYVRTQFGCDKFCSYCIVPKVRGPEQARPPEEILAETKALADQGVVEITLIGQTVNSHRHRSGGKTTRLSDLLARVHEVPGIARVKFLTSFPNDMTDDLLEAVASLPKVCKYLHVPAQSGCDEVLARMRRHYTVADYREMLLRARGKVPGVAISSDFIVGFSGESEESFERSCALVREGRFKNSFIYQYSPRPGTSAFAGLPDDVPPETKKRRNNDLLAVQQEVSRIDHATLVGQEVEVLVEGPGRLPGQLTGRTMTDHIAVFDGPSSWVGRIMKLRVEEAGLLTLFARPLDAPAASHRSKPLALPVLPV